MNGSFDTIHPINHALRFGAPLREAAGAVILIHGRGSSAEDIAGLADALPSEGIAYVAPTASQGVWYPQRFFVPLAQNEPWLSAALEAIDRLVGEIGAAGLPFERIGLAGFSQGACLALEYAARHPRRYGFVAGLSGGLIGPLDTPRSPGDLGGTPVLVACAERDAHIPLDYVEQSAKTLSGLGADVTKKILSGGAHRIFPEEIEWLGERMDAWGRPG